MKKKLCFVVSAPMTVNAFLTNHITELSKDLDIYLVANFYNEDLNMFDDLPIIAIKDIAIPRKIDFKNDVAALFSLKYYFKEMQFDAVHTVTPKAGLLGITAARLAKIKIRIHIFTGQVWHTKSGFFKKLLMFLDRVIVHNATHILVDGESQRQFLIKSNIVKEHKSYVLGKGSISGVDSNRFVPNEQLKEQIREELNINSNEIVVMFLGRMNKDKGIPELAKAFDLLSKKHRNLRLLFVGDDEQNMTSLVKDYIKNIEKVIFYGPTTEPERLLQACDIFCLPSHREGFGTSVIEAALLEKPIVCSNTYGLMETIINNKTGIRHEVNNVSSLYNAIETLVVDENIRLTYGTAGREYILEHFTAQNISREWVGFYQNLLS